MSAWWYIEAGVAFGLLIAWLIGRRIARSSKRRRMWVKFARDDRPEA